MKEEKYTLTTLKHSRIDKTSKHNNREALDRWNKYRVKIKEGTKGKEVIQLKNEAISFFMESIKQDNSDARVNLLTVSNDNLATAILTLIKLVTEGAKTQKVENIPSLVIDKNGIRENSQIIDFFVNRLCNGFEDVFLNGGLCKKQDAIKKIIKDLFDALIEHKNKNQTEMYANAENMLRKHQEEPRIFISLFRMLYEKSIYAKAENSQLNRLILQCQEYDRADEKKITDFIESAISFFSVDELFFCKNSPYSLDGIIELAKNKKIRIKTEMWNSLLASFMEIQSFLSREKDLSMFMKNYITDFFKEVSVTFEDVNVEYLTDENDKTIEYFLERYIDEVKEKLKSLNGECQYKTSDLLIKNHSLYQQPLMEEVKIEDKLQILSEPKNILN